MTKPALAILRAGTHTASNGQRYTFNDTDIEQIAAGYDAMLSEAPIVVGHPKTDAPAYGWAKSLRVADGTLYAEPHQVEPQFAELVNAGRLKKISVSLFPPEAPNNPTPGKYYLRHIGFLGAQPPAVKGLPSAQFADDENAIEFSGPMAGFGYSVVDILSRLRDWFVEREGAEEADKLIPQWQLRSITEITERHDNSLTPSTFADDAPPLEIDNMSDDNKAIELAERERKIAEREQALAKTEAAARRKEVADFADGLVASGQLLPKHRGAIVEVLLALPADTQIAFADGNGKEQQRPAADALRGFLQALPRQIDFSEKSADDGSEGAVDFAAPDGSKVATDDMDTYSRAKEYQAQHPNTPWLTAVAAVKK